MPADSTHGSAVPDEVRAHLVTSLGSDAITITDAGAARLPTGGSVRVFHAAVKGRPNQVTAVTLDDSGELRPLARLVEDLGRNPFVPDFTPVRPGTRAGPRGSRSRSTRRPTTGGCRSASARGRPSP